MNEHQILVLSTFSVVKYVFWSFCKSSVYNCRTHIGEYVAIERHTIIIINYNTKLKVKLQ